MTWMPPASEASPTDNCHKLQNPNKINIYSRYTVKIWGKSKSRPITGLEWPRGFQEVKVPRFLDNGTGCC
jgi:hypothetical protein